MSMRHMDPHGVLKYTGRIKENRWEEEGDFVLPLQQHHPAVMCLIRNKNQRGEWDLRGTFYGRQGHCSLSASLWRVSAFKERKGKKSRVRMTWRKSLQEAFCRVPQFWEAEPGEAFGEDSADVWAEHLDDWCRFREPRKNPMRCLCRKRCDTFNVLMGQTIQTWRGDRERSVTLDAKRQKWALEANRPILAN